MTSSSIWSESARKGETLHVHQCKSFAIKGLSYPSDPLQAKIITGMDLDGLGRLYALKNMVIHL
jgi:hypothetical protein